MTSLFMLLSTLNNHNLICIAHRTENKGVSHPFCIIKKYLTTLFYLSRYSTAIADCGGPFLKSPFRFLNLIGGGGLMMAVPIS